MVRYSEPELAVSAHFTTSGRTPANGGGAVRRDLVVDAFGSLIEQIVSVQRLWICAPPGAGKFLLAEAALDRAGFDAVYCRIVAMPEDDYVVVVPDSDRAGVVSARMVGDLAAQLAELARDVAEIANNRGQKYALVIDLTSCGTSCTNAHDALIRIGEQWPMLRWIAISRSIPTRQAPSSESVAQPMVVGWEAFRMSVRSVSAVLGRPETDHIVSRVHALSHGLLRHVLFINESLRDDGYGCVRLHFDELAGRLHLLYSCARQCAASVDLWDMCRQCAFLPEITHEKVTAVTGRVDSGSFLEFFTLHFPYLEPLNAEATTFTWGTLFRKFILSECKRAFTPEYVGTIRNRSDTLPKRSDALESIFSVHVETEDWDAAVALIKDNAEKLLSIGASPVVREMISSIPAHQRAHDTQLAFWLGRSLMSVDPQAACDSFALVLEACRPHGGSALFFHAALWFVAASRMSGHRETDVPGLLDDLLMLRAVGNSNYERASITLCLAASLYGFDLNDSVLDEAPSIAAELRAASKSDLPPETNLLCNIALLNYCAYAGDLGAAAQLISDTREVLRTTPVADFLMLHWDISLASYQFEIDRAMDAIGLLEGVLSKIGDNSRFQHLIMTVRLRMLLIYLDMGDPRAQSMAVIVGVASRPQISPCNRVLTAAAMACASLQNGRPLDALEMIRSVSSVLRDRLVPLNSRLRALLAHAHVLLSMNQSSSLTELIDQIRSDAERSGARQFEVQLYTLGALVAVDLENVQEARRHLQAAFSTSTAIGRFPNLGLSRREMTLVCTRALELGVPQEQVATVIQSKALQPDQARVSEAWPWRYKVYTLGNFLVVKNDAVLRFAGKAQRRPLDLLKVIVARGGKAVDLNIVISELWPESPGDLAHKSFDSTLHRLRKLLSDDAIIQTNRSVSLNCEIVWTDLSEFNQLAGELLDEMDLAHPDVNRDDFRRKVSRIFQIYKGDFLSLEEEAAWVTPIADRIRNRFFRFIDRIGNVLEREGRWRDVIEIYRRGIEVDNLSEDLYRRLMEAQYRSGNIADALETYRRCRHILSVVLGIAPSERTTSKYRELMAQ